MKLLNGKELAGYIKQRQAKEVRELRQSNKLVPKLAIVQTTDNPVIDLYVRLKKSYGADIGVTVDAHRINQAKAMTEISCLNEDSNVHGIIIQLPLAEPTETDTIVNMVKPFKDVDALGKHAVFEPATPMAILWLLAGYNIDLAGKQVLLVGRGKLVGAPLEKMLRSAGINLDVVDLNGGDLNISAPKADVIITAAGRPSLLKSDMVKQGAIVVDAGVASEGGKTVGDADPELYERGDLTITPVKGGVGPLTVCALFENVIRAARAALKVTS